MKIKTSELKGRTLEWAVLKCLIGDAVHYTWEHTAHRHRYSTDWAQGGPIIEREKIDMYYSTANALWAAAVWRDVSGGGQLEHKQTDCPTPLIAAMRVFVASKLGNEVEVPDELA